MKNRLKQNHTPQRQRNSFVINLYSWTTPVVGLIMLVAGFLSGYLARPLLDDVSQVTSPNASTNVSSPSAAPASIGQAELPSSRDELMDFLVNQARHFKGDPEAPVTMIEFSDFQ